MKILMPLDGSKFAEVVIGTVAKLADEINVEELEFAEEVTQCCGKYGAANALVSSSWRVFGSGFLSTKRALAEGLPLVPVRPTSEFRWKGEGSF